tara:strand:+ start:742 stop:1026 length:285 start_codon:yes stop_codon:yes gene_type:complete
MKKLIISASILMSFNIYSQTIIYCKPDINKCIENLTNLEQWLLKDYQNGLISSKTHDEYYVAVTHTISSLKMILKDEGQCDTTNDNEKLKYWTK